MWRTCRRVTAVGVLVALVMTTTGGVASASSSSVSVRAASTTLRPGDLGFVEARVQGVPSCSLRIGGQRRAVEFDPQARHDVVYRFRINRSARPGRYVAALACGSERRTIPLTVRRTAKPRARYGRLLRGAISARITRSTFVPAPGPDAPAVSGESSGEGADRPVAPAAQVDSPSSRVRTWTFDQPFAIPTSGPVALVHFWGGCPTCNSEPGYEQIQSWADAHPEVTVIAFSCMRDLHTQWLANHPSWRREPGFAIYLPGGDVGAFDTCIRRIGSGLRPVYHTNAHLLDGQVQPFLAAPWFSDWPLRRR